MRRPLFYALTVLLLALAGAGCGQAVKRGALDGSGGGDVGGSGGMAGGADIMAAGDGLAGGAAGGGGSGGQGGGGGTAPPDAAPGVSPVAAGPCTAVLCEDFEKSPLDKTAWTIVNSGKSTVTVQGAKVAHGQGAVRFHGEPGGNFVTMSTKALSAALRTHMFGRVYFYLTPRAPNGHTPFISAGHAGPLGSDTPYGGIEIISDLSWYTGISGDRAGSMGGKVPLDNWVCLEWEFNEQPGVLTLWIDGKQQTISKSFGNNAVGGFAQLTLGFRAYTGGFAVVTDMYLDDLAVDTRKVGCIE